jgi:hypothetical protein
MSDPDDSKKLGNTPDGNSLWWFLLLLIDEPKRWKGIAILTGIVTAIVAIPVLTAIYVMRPERIEIPIGYGTIILKRGNTQNALFLLSSNGRNEDTPWVETGIAVKKGDLVKITANGRIHTSIKKLIAHTQTLEIDERSWVSPKGSESKQDLSLLSKTNKRKLLPDKDGAYYGYGMLLAAIKPSTGQIKTENIAPFDKDREYIEFTANTNGELVLTVNDIWLNKEDKDIYAPPLNKEENFKYYRQIAYSEAALKGENVNYWSKETERKKIEEQHQKRLKKWELIVANNNWNVWYDDNLGAFSVSITVNPETK